MKRKLRSTVEPTVSEGIEIATEAVENFIEETPVQLKKKRKKSRHGKSTNGEKSCERVNDHMDNPIDYYLVPWANEQEWKIVCENFRTQKYGDVIMEIDVWRERVPSLPVGVEATAAMLRAVEHDQEVSESGNSKDEETRSLYSLAIVRFLNLVSDLATRELPVGHVPLVRMAGHLNVPDWIVDIRQEVSHGASLPSREFLQTAGDVVLKWLGDNYWTGSYDQMLVADCGSRSKLLVAKALKKKRDDEAAVKSEAEQMEEIRTCISSYVACKIYKMRGKRSVTDVDILRQCHSDSEVVQGAIPIKLALGQLKQKVGVLMKKRPVALSKIVGEELVFTDEFLDSFAELFQIDRKTEYLELIEKCRQVWSPILVAVKNKDKLPVVFLTVAEYLKKEDSSQRGKTFAGCWLEIILCEIERKSVLQDVKSFNKLVKGLGIVVLNAETVPPNLIPSLLDLLRDGLEPKVLEELSELVDICSQQDVVIEEKKNKKSRRTGPYEPFTVDQISNEFAKFLPSETPIPTLSDTPSDISDQSNFGPLQNWQVHPKGASFWMSKPFGEIIG